MVLPRENGLIEVESLDALGLNDEKIKHGGGYATGVSGAVVVKSILERSNCFY